MSEQAADLTAEIAANVIAFHRCVDIHPERHDQGGVGVCESCRSWGSHVATAIAPRVAALGGERARLAAVEALADKWQADINRGHADNPNGHHALTNHERDLDELRAALDAPAGDAGDVSK